MAPDRRERALRLEMLPLATHLSLRVQSLQVEITLAVTGVDASGNAPACPSLSQRRGFCLNSCPACGSAAVESHVPRAAPTVYRCRGCHVQWRIAPSLEAS